VAIRGNGCLRKKRKGGYKSFWQRSIKRKGMDNKKGGGGRGEKKKGETLFGDVVWTGKV